jgi:hypothetical protein
VDEEARNLLGDEGDGGVNEKVERARALETRPVQPHIVWDLRNL